MTLLTTANIGVKLALLAAAAFMLVFRDLPQFENKSLTLRAVFYPLFGLALYAGYRARRMRGPYPTLVDLCWTWTFALDIVSNNLNWYNAYTWWDDLIHFINAVPYMVVLVAGLLALERLGAVRLGYWGAALYALSIFAALHALWEMWEHAMDRFLGTQLQPGGMAEATENNLASILGSLVAVAIFRWWWNHSFRRTAVEPLAAYFSQLRPGSGGEQPPARGT